MAEKSWPFFLQLLHTISNEQLELVNTLAPTIEQQVLPILKDTQTIWQPADFLPDSSSQTFLEEVRYTLPFGR